MGNFNFSLLSPVERIALAETLYDSAMQEIEAMAAHLTREQLADIDRRIAEVEAGSVELIAWDEAQTIFTRRA